MGRNRKIKDRRTALAKAMKNHSVQNYVKSQKDNAKLARSSLQIIKLWKIAAISGWAVSATLAIILVFHLT